MNTASKILLFIVFSVSSVLSHSSGTSATMNEHTMCVFDILATAGPTYNDINDYAAEMLGVGVKIKLKPYTDERIAAEDFKAGVCDLVNLTGLTSRSFNRFTGTIDSIGAIPTYSHLKTIVELLSSQKATKYMISGQYEVVGIVPSGAVFAFVNDRSINHPNRLGGKKIGVLENAPDMQFLVNQVGLSPVASTMSNVFHKFNNGVIDITGSPAIGYEVMELNKGLGEKGGILNYPLLQFTLQVISRKDMFSDEFKNASKAYFLRNIDSYIEANEGYEARIPEKYWVDVTSGVDVQYWVEVFRQNRIALRDEGIYSGKALNLFRKIRCHKQPDLGECAAPDRE